MLLFILLPQWVFTWKIQGLQGTGAGQTTNSSQGWLHVVIVYCPINLMHLFMLL